MSTQATPVVIAVGIYLYRFKVVFHGLHALVSTNMQCLFTLLTDFSLLYILVSFIPRLELLCLTARTEARTRTAWDHICKF